MQRKHIILQLTKVTNLNDKCAWCNNDIDWK